jgi:hypothetical protein
MKILDKIVLNRLISIITSFVLGLIKIFAPNKIEELDLPDIDDKRRKPRWRK